MSDTFSLAAEPTQRSTRTNQPDLPAPVRAPMSVRDERCRIDVDLHRGAPLTASRGTSAGSQFAVEECADKRRVHLCLPKSGAWSIERCAKSAASRSNRERASVVLERDEGPGAAGPRRRPTRRVESLAAPGFVPMREGVPRHGTSAQPAVRLRRRDPARRADGGPGRALNDFAKWPERLVEKGFWADFVVGGLWLSGVMEASSALAIHGSRPDGPACSRCFAEAERLDRMVQHAQAWHRVRVVRAAPRHLGHGCGDLGRRRMPGFLTATPPWVVTAPRRWRRSWRRSWVPRWVSPPSPRCR